VKVFSIQTHEPEEEFMLRFQDGRFLDLVEMGVYADREKAELVAEEYNKQYNDEKPAEVVELEVL
jgi:hypothetical protein